MSRDLNQLLQECLAGLDSGLTPEECLSAWPEERAGLEPMLRQALLLRVAFTAAPSEEFKARARDRLMFAAGREARQALAAAPSAEFKARARDRLMFVAGREARRAFDAEPRDAFVRQARQRLLSAGGASAQESLRSVPPPRLAFWVNARRRLLEAASSRRMAPAPQAMALRFRTGLSAAIIVLAVAVAGLAYFTVQTPETSVGAQLALLEQRVNEVEQKVASGEAVSPAEMVELNLKLEAVAPKITEESQASKAKSLAERQKELTEPVAAAAPEALAALNRAEQNITQAEVRIFAARAETPNAVQTQPPAPPTDTPRPSATAPKATSTPAGPTPTPVPLGPNEIRMAFLAGDTAWVEISTTNFRMLVPSNWVVAGVTFNADHIGKLGESRWIVIHAPPTASNNVTIAVNVTTGQMWLSVNGGQDLLRPATGTQDTALTTKELVEKTDSLAGQIFYMLQSVVHTPPTPTPSPSPSATPTATRTPSPPPSASPSATP